MSLPASLRSPLLWLLLPFMGGLVWADWQPVAENRLKWVAGGAAIGAVTAIALARRTDRLSVFWAGSALLFTAFSVGCLWLPLRSPPRIGWTAPPRELNVVLEIEQVFTPLPSRRTYSGLARVVEAEGPAAPLLGQRIHFAAIRRISPVPEVSARYRYRGVVEPVPREDESGRGFNRYLESLGIRVRLTRGQLREQVRPPSAFRQFCVKANRHLESLLRHGLEHRPEIVPLYLAMLLGEKAVLSAEQQSAFVRTGVFHVFTISGLHVGVIAVALLGAFALLRVPRRAAALASLAVLWLYVQVTGGNTPAERAFLMIAFFTAARIFRLPGNPVAALAAAALATLLIEPRQLFTAGFQMSYSVVTALIVMALPLSNRWKEHWKPWRDLPEADWRHWHHATQVAGERLLAGLAITWAAVLASTPSTIGHFGLCTPGALLGNLIIVPIASLAIIAGFASLLAGLVGLLPLSLVFNHAAALLITIMEWLVQHGSALPGAHVGAAFGAGWMAPAALVIVVGSMLLGGSRAWREVWIRWLPPAALGIVLILGVKFG